MRMAIAVGHIEEFNPDKEQISTYLERLELFFVANEVVDEKQVATLLSVIGGKTYALLRDLLAPDKPASKSLGQLKDTLRAHFEPKPVVIAERFQFHRRNQEAGELVAGYDAELRRLATNCKFGYYLSQAIRDRLVCGLRSESTQKWLLAEADLMLAKALEIAQSMEAADRNTQRLKGSSEPQPVSEIRRENTHGSGSLPRANRRDNLCGSGSRQCFRCGSDSHKSHECRYIDAVCHSCGKKGHLARVCRSSCSSQSQTRYIKFTGSKSKPPNGRLTQWVDMPTTEQETEPFPDDSILRIQGQSTKPITVTLQLNGKAVDMEVDTGASFLDGRSKTKEVVPSGKAPEDHSEAPDLHRRVLISHWHLVGPSEVSKLCGKTHTVYC